MGKAISGEGSIRQRKSGKLAGKWRVQWGYDDPISNEFVPVDKTFRTQGEATDYLGDLKAKIRTGQLVRAANSRRALTLASWFDELAGTKDDKYEGLWAADGLRSNTIAYRVGRFNKYVRTTEYADMPLKHLTGEEAKALFRDLRKSGAGTATLVELKRDLVKVLNDAIDTYERVPNLRNPFAKVKLTSPQPREAVTLNPLQAKAALARQTTERDRAMLGLYLLAGLRLSEQMAITKEQIDFHREVIVVDRAVKLDRTGVQTIGLPKGDKTRLVAMCPSLAKLLKPLMDQPGEYLFPSATQDKPRMKKLVYATWRKIRRRAKLPTNTVLRDCRLSHNNWIEKLMPTVSTSTRLEHMGHSTTRADGLNKGIAVNLKNYTRFLSESQEILRDELERVLGLGDVVFTPLVQDDEDELEIAS